MPGLIDHFRAFFSLERKGWIAGLRHPSVLPSWFSNLGLKKINTSNIHEALSPKFLCPGFIPGDSD
jgi:hypothetical protein